MPPNLSVGAIYQARSKLCRLSLTLSHGLFPHNLVNGTKKEHKMRIAGTTGTRNMRAALGDLVEILAIGLFVAGIGAVGAALHAVA